MVRRHRSGAGGRGSPRRRFATSTGTNAPRLKADAARGEAGDGSRYYDCCPAALELLVVTKQLSDRQPSERKGAWAEAYRHTPHGMPVELKHDSD